MLSLPLILCVIFTQSRVVQTRGNLREKMQFKYIRRVKGRVKWMPGVAQTGSNVLFGILPGLLQELHS